MENRISSSYSEGRSLGDLGYSNLLLGEQVSKGSAFGAVYSSIEWLQHGILKYISYDEATVQVEDVDLAFLDWLYQALFGLSAFCYRKGNTRPEYGLIIPERAYSYLTERIQYFKSQEEEVLNQPAESEFIALKGTLNKLRLQARDVERNYVAWFSEEIIIKEYLTQPDVFDNIMKHQRFLNRLSSYFYWLIRHAALRQDNTHTTQWISQIPNFIL
jgi:cob(I)alamin adenosyltransferase